MRAVFHAPARGGAGLVPRHHSRIVGGTGHYVAHARALGQLFHLEVVEVEVVIARYSLRGEDAHIAALAGVGVAINGVLVPDSRTVNHNGGKGLEGGNVVGIGHHAETQVAAVVAVHAVPAGVEGDLQPVDGGGKGGHHEV